MYVSIDMDQLRFLHKHDDVKVVANLVFIEAPGRHVDIIPVDSLWLLKDATETELQKLYRNTTDAEATYGGAALRAALIELAKDLPATDVNTWELEAQAAQIESKHPNGVEGVVYVKGSTVVTQASALFKPLQLKGKLSPEAVSRAAQAHSAAPRAPGEVAPPRKGSVRDIIWSVADKVWEADGKPVDKSSVLQLRKQIMDVLEKEHGVKRTSSSNELGNWQKARI